MLFLLLAAADPETGPVEAERAFARAAQANGQWTAFREFMTDDATIFVPQPVKAVEWLKDRRDPPKSVEWWPTESYVSCDGKLAVNTGGWKQPNGAVGYFSTVWRRGADGGWKWTVDGGDELKSPRDRPGEPKIVRASCGGRPHKVYFEPCQPTLIKCSSSSSPDGTLTWSWTVRPDGARTFQALLWNGEDIDQVIDDNIAAPPK